MSEAFISIRGLKKNFGKNEVLKGVDLDVKEGRLDREKLGCNETTTEASVEQEPGGWCRVAFIEANGVEPLYFSAYS